MAKPTPTVYKVPRTHPVACKMKKGGLMHVKMRMMPDGEDKENYSMQEEMAEEAAENQPGAPSSGTKPKKKSAVDYVKSKRNEVT